MAFTQGIVPCTFCGVPLALDQLFFGADRVSAQRRIIGDWADRLIVGLVAICERCTQLASDRFAGTPPAQFGVYTSSGEVTLGGISAGGSATAYMKELAEVGTTEREIMAYRLGASGGTPHSVEETAKCYGISAGDLAELEERFDRVTPAVQTVDERLDALHRFNTEVMRFRLGFVDMRLHTLLEVCDRFGLTAREAQGLERRFIRSAEEPLPEHADVAMLGLFEREMIAFRIGLSSRPHTVQETATRFCTTEHEVERVMTRIVGCNEPEGELG